VPADQRRSHSRATVRSLGPAEIAAEHDHGEQNTNTLYFANGRGSEARAADRGEHSCCAKAGELGRASFPCAGVRHCGCDYNCGADPGEDRQQVADAEHGIEFVLAELPPVKRDAK